MSLSPQVVVSGGFGSLQARDLRLLEEAAKLGSLTVLLWPDALLKKVTGEGAKFPLEERVYFLNAVRYVSRVMVVEANGDIDSLPQNLRADVWADYPVPVNTAREEFCRARGIARHVFTEGELSGFPGPSRLSLSSGREKVVVTGSFDWFHSGHVRFFEEASGLGDLYVVVGHDANIRLLKGAGHPLVLQDERRYVVGSIKFVKEALISSGEGWLDAEPEIRQLKPDIYVVNEDGDKGGKREYCRAAGIEYVVLKRMPAPGLPRRSSTDLRGF